MIIECTQENLHKALSVVSRMVGTRGTLPVLGNILLSAEKGRLRLAATDLEVGIQTWIGGKIEAEGAITVPARLLVDFVSTNTDPKIRLSVEETTLHLTSDHFTANIKGIAASEFPLIPEIKRSQPLTLGAKLLRETILQTVFATAIDETRPVLTGVFCRVDDGKLLLAATDSYRLAEKRIPIEGQHKDLSVIIPARTLQEFARIIGDSTETVSLYISENQMLFTVGDTELISRLIDGTFPDYRQIIPKDTTTEVTLSKSAFSQVMKMASFFARESANNVRLVVDPAKKKIIVTAVSPQIGDTVSDVAAEVSGESVEIAFNAKFILDALAILPGDSLAMYFSGKLQPGVLRVAKQDDYLYLIMPLRIDE